MCSDVSTRPSTFKHIEETGRSPPSFNHLPPSTMTMEQPSDASLPPVARPLGRLERVLAATYTNGLYNGTSVACQYTIPPRLLVWEEHEYLVLRVRRAIAKAILEHPLGQVGIIEAQGKQPSWVLLKELDLASLTEWHVAYVEEEYHSIRQKFLKRQLDTKFSSIESQPGWRVVVIHKHPTDTLDIFFVFNHVNFDGQAGKIFHEDLLRHLNHLSSSDAYLPGLEFGSRSVFSTNATKSNIPPPVESMAQFPISPLYTISTLWKKLAPPLLRTKTPVPPEHAWPSIITTVPIETALKTVKIPMSTVEGALAACRARNNTTITALLHALTVVSLTQQLPESKMAAMQSVTTIDLRRHMSHPLSVPPGHTNLDPRRTMANIVGRLTHRFDPSIISMIRSGGSDGSPDITHISSNKKTEKQVLSPGVEEAIWSVAAKVRSEIQERLDMGLRDNELGMMRFADDFRGFVKGTLNRPRVCTFLVSNLVLIDGEPDRQANQGSERSKWTIKRAAFTLSAHVNGAGIHLGVITVKGGDMVIDLTWQRGVVDDEICEQLGEDLETWLGHIAMQEPHNSTKIC